MLNRCSVSQDSNVSRNTPGRAILCLLIRICHACLLWGIRPAQHTQLYTHFPLSFNSRLVNKCFNPQVILVFLQHLLSSTKMLCGMPFLPSPSGKLTLLSKLAQASYSLWNSTGSPQAKLFLLSFEVPSTLWVHNNYCPYFSVLCFCSLQVWELFYS